MEDGPSHVVDVASADRTSSLSSTAVEDDGSSGCAYWLKRVADGVLFILTNTFALASFWLYPLPHSDHRRRRFCGAGALWLVNFVRLVAFGVLLIPAWFHAIKFYVFSLRLLRNVEYGRHNRNKLDLFLPSRYHIHDCFAHPEKRCPVVVFFPGGAWMIGYKAWGALMGKMLIDEGVLFVAPDYRNFPQATVPEMLDDVDAVMEWVVSNIAAYGGDPDNIFLAGQSAGAHLSTLATLFQAQRESTAGSEGLTWSATSVRGCLEISGPYDVPGLMPHFNKRGLNTSVVLSIFGKGDPTSERRLNERLEACGVPKRATPSYDEVVHDLSPTRLLADGRISRAAAKLLPPFTLMHGTGDETCPCCSSEDLAAALKGAGATADLELFPGKTHTDPIIEDPLGGTTDGLDPLVTKCLESIDATTTRKRAGNGHRSAALAPKFLIRLAAWCNPF